MSKIITEKWKDIASRLKTIIEKEGITASGFAKRIDVTPQTVANILNGRNLPSLELLVKILSVFPWVTADWLLLGDDSQQEVPEEELLPIITQQAKTIVILSNRLAAAQAGARVAAAASVAPVAEGEEEE